MISQYFSISEDRYCQHPDMMRIYIYFVAKMFSDVPQNFKEGSMVHRLAITIEKVKLYLTIKNNNCILKINIINNMYELIVSIKVSLYISVVYLTFLLT